MPSKCCVPGCKSNYKTLNGTVGHVSVFRFPSDEKKAQSWLTAINREPTFQPSKTASVCIKHFREDQIVREDRAVRADGSVLTIPRTNLKLSADAVPCIFPNRSGTVTQSPARKRKVESVDELETKCWETVKIEECTHLYPEGALGEGNGSDVSEEKAFVKLCRTCLGREGVLFQILNTSYEDTPIKDLLKTYTFLEVTEDDGLPQNICESCINRLSAMHIFKNLCLASDSFLRESAQVSIEQYPENEAKKDSQQSADQKLKRNCPICGKLVLRTTCTNHEPVRTNIEEYLCSECPKMFKSNGDLSNHMMIHIIENDPAASEIFDVKNEEEHSTSATSEIQKRTRLCPICGKLVPRAGYLNHQRVHENRRQFACAKCPKRFNTSSDRINHMTVHIMEEDKMYGSAIHKRKRLCSVCGKLILRTTYSNHLRVHQNSRQFVCPECPKRFNANNDLGRHMQSHSGEKRHFCETCGTGFLRHSNLTVHKRIHTGEKPFICTVCNRSFSQPNHLKHHLHIHSGEKPFVCNICNKGFTQRTYLKYHLNVHSGIKLYPCDVCKKAFSQACLLKCHMRVHSDDNPFKCTYCGKCFSGNGTLRVHIRIHTGEKPYVCAICNISFYASSALNKHKQKRHPNN